MAVGGTFNAHGVCYNPIMLDDIRGLLDRDPFVPFRIILTSGQVYEVLDPHSVGLGQTQLNIYPPKSDRWSIIRLNQIASVDVGQAAA
jgi:hypothetical protein